MRFPRGSRCRKQLPPGLGEQRDEVGIITVQKLEEEPLPSCDLALRVRAGVRSAGPGISLLGRRALRTWDCTFEGGGGS